MTDLRARAIQIYDTFTHEHRDRRMLLREMVGLAGSVAAAEALIAGIAASPASAQIVPEGDARLKVEMASGSEAGAPASAYLVAPADARGKRLGTVIVIHENRGLTPHIKDVARRIALEGFRAIAPDLLAPQGGTPVDEDKARALIASADLALAARQVLAYAAKAKAQAGSSGKAGLIGFCWGGAMVNRVAVAGGHGMDAGVAYYGPAPSPAEAAQVQAPLMLHYAGKDARVNATGTPWVAALKAAGKPVEAFTYEGVDHAFNNDSSAERYDASAAALAWGRTVAFLHRHLDASR